MRTEIEVRQLFVMWNARAHDALCAKAMICFSFAAGALAVLIPILEDRGHEAQFNAMLERASEVFPDFPRISLK